MAATLATLCLGTPQTLDCAQLRSGALAPDEAPRRGAECEPSSAAALGSSDKNRRYRDKGGRKVRANLREFGKRNRFTSSFIITKFGKFRANPANFAQLRPILFLSAFFWNLHPRLLHPPFVRSQPAGLSGHSGATRSLLRLRSAWRRTVFFWCDVLATQKLHTHDKIRFRQTYATSCTK